MSIVSTSRDEKVPSSFLALYHTPTGRSANLNAGFEDQNLIACFTKDCAAFDLEALGHQPSDLKYITPLLIALQMQDTSLGCLALEILESLVSSHFFSKISARGTVRHAIALPAVLKAISASMSMFDKAFQTAAVNLLLSVIRHHFVTLSIVDIVDVFVASFLVSSLSHRDVLFQDFIKCSVAYMTRDQKQVAMIAKAVARPSDLPALAQSTRQLIALWMNLSLSDLRFPHVVADLAAACSVCDGESKLISALLVISKVALRSGTDPSMSAHQNQALNLLEYSLRRLPSDEDLRADIQKSDPPSQVSSGLAFIYRRVVFSAVSASFEANFSDATFACCLSFVSTAWKKHMRHFSSEVGIVLHSILLEYLEQSSTSSLRRVAILYQLQNVFKSAAATAAVFLNNDGTSSRPLFERLIKVLCSVVGENSSALQNLELRATSESLRNHALSLLLDIVEFMYECTETLEETTLRKQMRQPADENGSSSLAALTNAPRAMRPSIYLSRPASSPASSIVSDASTASTLAAAAHGSDNQGPCVAKLAKSRQDADMLQGAIQLAREKSLEKAVKQLITVGFMREDDTEIATFVHTHADSFELETVGEYLGGTRCVYPLCFDIFVHVNPCVCLLIHACLPASAYFHFLMQSVFIRSWSSSLYLLSLLQAKGRQAV